MKMNFNPPLKKFAVCSLQFALCVLLIANCQLGAYANNLSVGNISYNQSSGTVTFDISWNNSWRSSTTSAANWDAAWVFIKWRDCSSSNSVQFTHGFISPTVGDHNFNVNSGVTTYE